MFGLQVNREHWAWKKLTPIKRGIVTAIAAFAIAGTAAAAFLSLQIVGATSGNAAASSGITINAAASACSISTGPGTCVLSAGANSNSFNLALNATDNDSVVDLAIRAQNASGGPTLCLSALPADWTFGSTSDGSVVDVLKNIAAGAGRDIGVLLGMAGITPSQSLAGTVTFNFTSSGCTP